MAGDRIEVTIELIDEISDRLEKIEGHTGSMTGSMFKANVAMAAASAAMNVLKGAAKALGNVMKEAVIAASNFEYDMVRIGNVGNITGDELSALGDNIRDMGIKSIFTTQEMQTAFYELAAAGDYTDDELTTLMGSFTELATATGSDLVQSTVAASKAMNAFGLSADQASNVADTLTQAANMSALEVTDLTIALGYVGGQAHGAGMDIQETSAVLAQLSNQGYNASMGATNFRMAIKEMASPTKESKKILRKLNIEFFDAEGNMRNMTDIIPELNTAMSGLTTKTKLQHTETLFGVRSGGMMLSMMNAEGAAARGVGTSLGDLTDAMYEQGVASAQAGNITQTTKAQFDILTGTVKDLAMDLGMGVIGSEGMQEAIAGLTEILSDPALKEALTLIGNAVGDVLIAVMPLLGEIIQSILPIIAQLAEFLSDLLPIIQPLITFIGTFLKKAFEVLGPILEKLLPVILELAEVVIAALMPAFEEFLPILDELGPLFDALIPIVEMLIPIVEALAPIIKLVAAIMANQLRMAIKSITVVLNLLLPVFDAIRIIIEVISAIITPLSDGIELLVGMFQLLANPLIIIDALLKGIQEAIGGVVDGMVSAGSDILDFITFWDPPGPCLAEAIGESVGSLQDFKRELQTLPNDIDVVIPSVNDLTTNFTGQDIDDQSIAHSFIGGVADEAKTVNITIEGDVKDDETINKIVKAATGEDDNLGAVSNYYMM